MDRGVCWATVHGVPELDTTEQLILSLSIPRICGSFFLYLFLSFKRFFFFNLDFLSFYLL